jgi:tetratricopeptide (TPR) repeat protein
VNTLLLVLALLTADPGANSVLGADAATAMERWIDDLAGLRVADVRIDRDHVLVDLRRGCTLRVTENAPRSCTSPFDLQGAHGCLTGERCPSEAKLRRALGRAGPLNLPWRAVSSEASTSAKRVREARVLAQRRLDARDVAGAQSQLLPIAQDPGIRPRDRLSIVATLGAMGAGGAAWKILVQPGWSSEDPALTGLARVLLLAGPRLGAAMAHALLTRDNACGAVGLASGLLAGRSFRSAAELAETIRNLDASCFEAYRAEMTALAAVRDHRALAQVFDGAQARFGDDPRLMPLQQMAWYAADDVQSIVGALEARVEAGERSPGLFKQLLSLVVRERLRAEKMRTWLARAEADPTDRVAAFFAGVLLHYEREFERSNVLLDRAATELSTEPRLYIYRAMNAFNLGDRALAESAIGEAARLETQDPDVFYCQGEIFRDTDRPRAREALATYWFQTELNSDPRSSKQARVRGMMAALDRCIAQGTAAPCPGPWEHTFASAAPIEGL